MAERPLTAKEYREAVALAAAHLRRITGPPVDHYELGSLQALLESLAAEGEAWSNRWALLVLRRDSVRPDEAGQS